MFRVCCSPIVLQQLIDASKISTSLFEKLSDLENNPQSIAIPTNIEVLGRFYINAGRYCILFDIDAENKLVTILAVRSNSFVYKVINGKIS